MNLKHFIFSLNERVKAHQQIPKIRCFGKCFVHVIKHANFHRVHSDGVI